jgi:integrase
MKKITPINNNGSILLRFSVAKKRFSFTPIPGGRFDDLGDLARARAIATQIVADIKTGNFDTTLGKYKGDLKAIQTGIDKINSDLKELRQNQSKPDLKELWERFTVYKSAILKHSTICNDYENVKSAIAHFPTTNLNEAVMIRDWLLQNRTNDQAKRILELLQGCCEWAIESDLLEINPFSGMARRIKSKKSESEDIFPFTEDERDRIIRAFNHYFPNYSKFVIFLFFTGCRPSEAIPLTGKDLKHDKITFNKAFINNTLQKGLKTQEKRVITLTVGLTYQLQEIPRNSDLIFPSPKGIFINWHNFSGKIWKSVLLHLPEIEYRKAYQCRHTFITQRLLAGDSPQDIAKYCGNSPDIIYRNYAGITRGYRPD